MAFEILDVSDEKAGWLRAELDAGEKIEWSGEPTPRLFTKVSLPQFLFAIPWTGFAVFWMASSFSMTQDQGTFSYVFTLFGLPFVGIGMFMLSAPLRDRVRLERTAYAVTNKRVLVIDHDLFRARRVRSFSGDELTAISKEQHESGTGDVFFAEERRQGKNGTYTTPIGFVGVRGPREAEVALRSLRGDA